MMEEGDEGRRRSDWISMAEVWLGREVISEMRSEAAWALEGEVYVMATWAEG